MRFTHYTNSFLVHGPPLRSESGVLWVRTGGGLRGSGDAQSTHGGEGSPSGSHSPWCTWLPESGGFAAPLLGACQLMRSGLSPTPTPTASGYMANRDLSWRWCLQPQPATIKQPQQAPRHSKQPASSHIKQPQQAETTPAIPHA